MAKKDRLGILMVDYNGTGNAKDAFKARSPQSPSFSVHLFFSWIFANNAASG